MLRDAEGTLDPWNAGKTQEYGVRKNGVGTEMGPRWDGHGQGTKTSASLYVNMRMMNKQEMIILMRALF
jgi:hypothetical protein